MNSGRTHSPWEGSTGKASISKKKPGRGLKGAEGKAIGDRRKHYIVSRVRPFKRGNKTVRAGSSGELYEKGREEVPVEEVGGTGLPSGRRGDLVFELPVVFGGGCGPGERAFLLCLADE